jgi:hypothetical protein
MTYPAKITLLTYQGISHRSECLSKIEHAISSSSTSGDYF